MNRSTIDRLYRRTFHSLVATAFRIVHHLEDAEDVVQDAFLKLLEVGADLAPGQTVEAWLEAEVTQRSLETAGLDSVLVLRPPPRRARPRAA